MFGEGHDGARISRSVEVRAQTPLGGVAHLETQRVAVAARGRREHPLVLDGGDEQHLRVVRASGTRQGRRGGEEGEDEGEQRDEGADHGNLRT